MTADAITLGLGIVLLAGGVGWRVRAIRRRRADFGRQARSALGDQDPATRRAAVAVVAGHGLSPVAELLLETIKRESDDSVLDAIAKAVARNQWEPSHRSEVFELRLWAQRRLEDQARQRLEKDLAFAQIYGWSPSGPESDAEQTDAILRLEKLPVFNGRGGVKTVSQASKGRSLALMAADGWRRLRVARGYSEEQDRGTEGGS